ncbi:MAG: peptidylprolyl isomerase [Chloroflexota bacterium]
MAKRNTTGLPKKKRRDEEDAQQDSGNLIGQLQAQVSDQDQLQRLVVASVGGVVGLLAILIAVALTYEFLVVPSQSVATVNGQSITVAEFQERVRLERTVLNQRLNLDFGLFVQLGQDPNQLVSQEPYSSWFQEISGQPELLGSRILGEMIDEQIIRDVAAERGTEIDEALVQEQIEQFFNFNRPEDEEAAGEPTETTVPTETPTPFVSPTPTSTPLPSATPTPTVEATDVPEDETDTAETGPTTVPTSTPRPTNTPQPTQTTGEREEEFNTQFDFFLNTASRRASLNEDTVRAYFEYQALLAALREDVTLEIGDETTYVNARHILVDGEETAQNILTALEEGESFAALAQANSTDTGSGSRGGDLGWSAATNYVPEFRDAVIEAEIGEIVGPVESQFGFHIIQVRARELREMTEQELQQAQNVAFEEWLVETTSDENNDIERGDNWPQHVPLEPAFIYEPVGVVTPQAEDHDSM